MVMSPKIKMLTIEEWRELGFYYDYIDEDDCWLFIGSKEGITKLCELIKEYIQKPVNIQISEHHHYGPYMYFKIVTWTEPRINKDGIYGSLHDLKRLADIIRTRLDKANPTDTIEIGKEYSTKDNSFIKIIIHEDNFDPASADSQLFED